VRTQKNNPERANTSGANCTRQHVAKQRGDREENTAGYLIGRQELVSEGGSESMTLEPSNKNTVSIKGGAKINRGNPGTPLPVNEKENQQGRRNVWNKENLVSPFGGSPKRPRRL